MIFHLYILSNFHLNNLVNLLDFHKKQGKLATLTSINVGQRFGVLDINENNEILSFREKNDDDCSVINGGYMIIEPKVFDYIKGDDTVFEKEPLEMLAKEKQLSAFKHEGFWKCMDTLRDKNQLEEMWERGQAPWKVWED